jgi:hypothetical protein
VATSRVSRLLREHVELLRKCADIEFRVCEPLDFRQHIIKPCFGNIVFR